MARCARRQAGLQAEQDIAHRASLGQAERFGIGSHIEEFQVLRGFFRVAARLRLL